MSLRASLDKILFTILLAATLSCASNPDGPGVVNHAPDITGITIGGGRPGIGAGTLIVVTAVSSDIDGDELSFEWGGDGVFSGSGESVTWHVPNLYGALTLECTISDGLDSDSYSRSVQVGRRFTSNDYGDPDQGIIRWDGSDGAPFYILQGSVIIDDAELVVDAGTLIYCDAGSKLTLLSGARFEGLHYDGLSVQFVPWAESSSSLMYWDGITINSPNMEIVVNGTYIKNAKRGISMMLGSTQTLDLLNSKFELCERGLEAAQISVRGEGLSFWECARGLQATSLSELVLTHCSFFECDEYGIFAGGTPGIVTRTQFSGDTKALFLGSGSQISMTGNVFAIPDPNPFMSIGGGYEVGSDSLDFRCSYWGDGVNSAAQILPRIERDASAPGLLIEAIAGSEFAICGDSQAPVIQGFEILAEGHPLEGAGGWEAYDFSLPHSGFPAMQLRLNLENEDQLSLTYDWSSTDDAYFYYEGGVAEDIQGGYFDPEGTSYPGQNNELTGSTIFAASNEPSSLSVQLRIEFVLDGELQSLIHEEILTLE